MNAGSLDAPRDRPEKESERERERMIDTGRPSCFGEQDHIALFLKRTFISFSQMMLCTISFGLGDL